MVNGGGVAYLENHCSLEYAADGRHVGATGYCRGEMDFVGDIALYDTHVA
jgi:hypothetical protein